MPDLDPELLDEIIKKLNESFDEILNNKKPLKKDKDGEFCKKCDNFYEFAEPNQPDGTLICYSCRKYG